MSTRVNLGLWLTHVLTSRLATLTHHPSSLHSDPSPAPPPSPLTPLTPLPPLPPRPARPPLSPSTRSSVPATHPPPSAPHRNRRYVSNEDFEKAVACYRHALRLDNRHYNAW